MLWGVNVLGGGIFGIENVLRRGGLLLSLGACGRYLLFKGFVVAVGAV